MRSILLLREAIASSLRLITCLFSFYGSDFDYLENCGEHVKFDYHHHSPENCLCISGKVDPIKLYLYWL